MRRAEPASRSTRMRMLPRSAPWREAHMWVPAPARAVDPRSAGVDQAALRMPPAFDRFDAPPLFICGCARSGTTWTLDLFERHPLVYAICESWVLTQGHGVTGVLAQSFWDLDGRARWAERVDTPFGAVQLLSYEEMVRDLGDLVARWMAGAADDGQRYLVAKEPLDVRAAAILFPEARFVHVIRDGRDVALSMRHAARTWDPTMGPDLPMSFHAEAWRRQVENIRAHASFLGDRYLEVRYEDMRADVVGAMRALFDFAGIPHDDRLLAEIAASTDLAQAAEKARRSGFRGGSAGRGRDHRLTTREAVAFDRAAGALLVDLGYENSRGGPLNRLLRR